MRQWQRKGPAASHFWKAPAFCFDKRKHMTSERQQTANRLNAQKSTGPLTPEGKAVSSENSHKHGFASDRFRVSQYESQEDFDQYTATLLTEYQPQTLLEKTLVRKMAQHYWLTQRAVRLQETCFLGPHSPLVTTASDHRELALYLRYHGQHDRAFHKCLSDLQKIQALRQSERRKEEVHVIRLAKVTTPKPEPKKLHPQPALVTPAVVETEALEIAA
jgi:hypothetical protein